MANFDWIPYLEGRYLSYYQIGILVLSAICLLFAFISFLVYLIASKIQTNQLFARGNPSPLTRSTKSLSYISIFVWLGFIPVICQALDGINIIEGMVGTLAVYLLGIYLRKGIKETHRLHLQSIQMQNMHSQNHTSALLQDGNIERGEKLVFLNRCLRGKSSKKIIVVAVVMSIFWNLFFYKTCISFFNEEIGYTSKTLGPAINTYWSRLVDLRKACPPGPPCHFYATIPQDPTTAVFFNIHTYSQIQSPVTLLYQQLDTSQPDTFIHKNATSYSYNQLQWLSSRKVHSVLLSNLKPNTQYLIKLKYDNQFYINTIYKTLPSDPNIPVTMMNAGDSGYTASSKNLSRLTVGFKPDIIFIGGDIAYDNNIPACSYTWDFFLQQMEMISNQVGYVVPLVLALGNHDAGLNQLSHTNITLDSTAFFKYFPQQFRRGKNGQIIDGVPDVKDRRSFLNFKWGQVSYTILDSGYLHSFHGIQKDFIKKTFEESRKQIKFVNYHVPIYSVCDRFDKNPERFLYALFHWVPLFDQYKVMTVFQNHVHSFKRTKPLRASQPAENGTVYMGDGAFGAVLQFNCHPEVSLEIFQKFKHKHNMWISTIRKDEVYHVALDSQGNKLDEFTMDNDAYQE